VSLPTVDLVYGAGALGLVGIVLAIWGLSAASRVRRRLRRVLRGTRESLEESLADAQESSQKAEARVRELEERLVLLEQGLETALTQVGVVRFNPFSDTGSDLSFAVALLNHRASGVVFTGLWGREEVRVYAKEIQNGDSRYALSQEERQAVELARTQKHRE
jgi:Flp pilus assembly protein TadB